MFLPQRALFLFATALLLFFLICAVMVAANGRQRRGGEGKRRASLNRAASGKKRIIKITKQRWATGGVTCGASNAQKRKTPPGAYLTWRQRQCGRAIDYYSIE